MNLDIEGENFLKRLGMLPQDGKKSFWDEYRKAKASLLA